MSIRDDPFNPDLRHLPAEIRRQVKEELWPGERLRWIGQPRARRQMWEQLLLPLTGLPVTASGAWLIAPPADPMIQLMALPFLLGGLGLLSAPWWALHRSRRTVYLLSDQRALILRVVGRELVVRSYVPASLQRAECRRLRGGSGDLIFQRFTDGGPGEGFLSIPEVQRVHALVRQLARTWRPQNS